jgi:hypothetical protein
MAEGWQVLLDAQSALAHTCIVMYYLKSAKLEFMFKVQKQITSALQQKFEEEWNGVNSLTEIKIIAAAVRDLRTRLREYLLVTHTEIVPKRNNTQGSVPSSPTTRRRDSENMRSPRTNSGNRNSLGGGYADIPKPVEHLTALLKGHRIESAVIFGSIQ